MKELQRDLQKFARYIRHDVPTVIGVEAVNHFEKNFQREGFDGQKWKPPLRKRYGRGADRTRKTLTGKTGDLGRSLKYRVAGNKIFISSDKPYAKIHNEGGRVNAYQHVRAHKRRVKGKSQQVRAHGRKMNFTMPKREFMGPSRKFDNKLERVINADIKKLLK